MDSPTPITEANKLLEAFQTAETKDRWEMPFPMGVFGTLRDGHGNNRLMHRAEIGLHVRGFMPHFIAHGLSISFRKNATAPFEAFFYRPEEWKKMIPSVDSLEGFSPTWAERQDYGYYRTLAYIHLLPASYEHNLFPPPDQRGWRSLGADRDLQIPPEQWGQYERVPCWVYSSKTSNKMAIEAGVDTVIWG